jgi:2-dehydro-3-deoxygalactonokinase
MSGQIVADWIAVDWGTSNLRVWAVSAEGSILAQAVSDQGMNTLPADGFEPALLALISGWLEPGRRTCVLCCGMVGARQGWVEAPYRSVPAGATDSAGVVCAPARDPRLDVRVVPGLKQTTPDDVMRGEETQIAGFLQRRPEFDGVLCLPGTHSKWVRISASEIVSFTTFMTGELFALLSERSVLRHSVDTADWEQASFDEGVAEGLNAPAYMAARLFSIRAQGLISALAPQSARARLSGLLIGLEIGGARPYWLGMEVVILGHHQLATLYQRALGAQGARPECVAAETATFDGLRALHARLDPKEPPCAAT